jgi:hypothetical protein
MPGANPDAHLPILLGNRRRGPIWGHRRSRVVLCRLDTKEQSVSNESPRLSQARINRHQNRDELENRNGLPPSRVLRPILRYSQIQ